METGAAEECCNVFCYVEAIHVPKLVSMLDAEITALQLKQKYLFI